MHLKSKKVDYLKESKRRDLELLATVSKKHHVPAKMLQDLLRASKKFSYENVSQSSRMKEYQEIIDYHFKE